MTSKKHILFTAISVLIISLALQGTSWAPVERRIDPMAAFIKNLVVTEWAWLSPLQGTYTGMNQFEDGTIVALHRPKDLHRLKETKLGNIRGAALPYTVESTETYRDKQPDHMVRVWQTSEAQENIRVTLVQAAYELWTHRRIKCIAQLKATDMVGNTFEICKTAPFSFATLYGQSISDSNGGEVWIITPQISGRQEPARGSNRPGWGK